MNDNVYIVKRENALREHHSVNLNEMQICSTQQKRATGIILISLQLCLEMQCTQNFLLDCYWPVYVQQ
jgi:hypothetical protein